MSDILKELDSQLQDFSISVKENILIKMMELCRSYHLDAEDMVTTWIAFSTTKKLSSDPNLEILLQFEREELLKVNKKSNKSHDLDFQEVEFIRKGYERTPEARKFVNTQSPRIFSPNSFSPIPSTPSLKYSTRKSSGVVVCSHGCEEPVDWSKVKVFSPTIRPFDDKTALLGNYMYMYETLRNCASVLNDMIEDAVMRFKKPEDHEWAPIQLPAMEPVPMIGRICCDGNGKLNAQSVLLEGSYDTSSGSIRPLDISQLENYSLFPGQIVAGLGLNNLGKKVVLNELFESSRLSFSEEAPSFGGEYDSLSVVVAAGPFTTSDSLSYEPFADLIKYLKENKPHVCILCGPLIDIKHEEIQMSNIPESYEDVFLGLLRKVTSSLEGIPTKLVFISSMRDAHVNPIYPTPPYESSQVIENVYFASDPCLINISGVIFGITSTDILMHLGKEEINYSSQPNDRLGRLCSHLLTERSFYPLYPPSEDINIEYEHFESHGMISVMPHILILPSDLRYFIKNIKGCCCINPERLTKSSVAGTFARINIRAVDPQIYSGSIMDCIQAEIIRI